MNSQFTDKQIRAYAAAFREGDAIRSGEKWCEIVVGIDFPYLSTKKECSKNHFIVNGGEEREFYGAVNGFNTTSLAQDRYRVTTLEDYELQGGEKIVWLGKSDHMRTFGKAYTVNENLKYLDDFGFAILPTNVLNWGIIPRYEMHIQVKNNPKRNVSDEEFDNFLNDLDKTLAPVKKDNQLEHVVHYSTTADREEEVLKIKTFDLLNHDMSKEEIITDLKEIAHIEINNGNYDIVSKVVELVKGWEEMK